MLLAIGDLLEELLLQMKGAPVRGQDTSVRSARVRGGSAANVAAIDAEMGGTPRLVCQVGEDALGHVLADDIRSRGVQADVRHAGATGVIVTTVALGVRSRLVDRGASRGPALLEDVDLTGVSQLYVAASAFTEDPLASAIEGLLASITDLRVPVVVGGPSAADLELLGVDAFAELMRALHPDAVVLNRAEHASVGCQPRQAIAGAAVTIVTAGPRPTLVLDGSGRVESVPVSPIDKIRDRTGTGDGFLAGFLASRRTGADAVSACHAGHRVAARVLQNVGPTVAR
ncbi:MAG: carbohydrate kinase family protein [Acidimicrobiales bacterium]|nr:carbohydrate kinase family protein [Acidimicrobiales bacterium]